MPRTLLAALLLGLTGIIAACGGGGGGGSAPAPTLASISVTAAASSIAVGGTTQLTATGTYSDGSTKALSPVMWTSATAGVATVSTTGLATAVAAGSTVITATSGTVSGTTTLTVTAALVSIAVTPAAPAITKGATQAFVATGTYGDQTTKVITSTVTWASSNTTVATISTTGSTIGTASALAAGSTNITATSGSIVGTTALTVNPPTLVSIAITPAAPIVINGSTTQLVLTGTYSDTSTQAITAGVTWTSATPTNATIGTSTGIAAGLVTGGATVITATLAGSTLVAAPVTLTVMPAEYAFVTNFGDNTVSSFSVGPGGILVANGPAVATGIQPYALAADSSGTHLYVLNYNSGTASSISEYTISASGTLTPLTTIATGAGPNGIAVSGSSLYVANYGGGGSVAQYTIGTGGQLTAGAVVASQGGAAAITINPAGTFAYVPNYTANTVSIFPIGTGGALGTPTILTLAANSAPVDVLVDPTGAFAYIANLGSASVAGYIAQYGINPSTGALTSLGTPTVATGGNPRWLALNPAGNGVYVPNAGLNTVQTFAIGTGGALSASGTPPATGTNPDFVVVDPTGQFVYVANRGAGVLGTTPPYASTVSQFAVGTGGALSPLSTPTVTTGLGPACILVTTAN